VELIDPLRLREGIVQGLAYVEYPRSAFRPGFYVFRAVADEEVQVGEAPVRMEMLQQGRVIVEEPAMALVWSLTVPPESAGLPPQVGVGFDILANGQIARDNCWSCPNGVTICIKAPTWDPDCPLPPPYPCSGPLP
jgi:hypothetical protein